MEFFPLVWGYLIHNVWATLHFLSYLSTTNKCMYLPFKRVLSSHKFSKTHKARLIVIYPLSNFYCPPQVLILSELKRAAGNVLNTNNNSVNALMYLLNFWRHAFCHTNFALRDSFRHKNTIFF